LIYRESKRERAREKSRDVPRPVEVAPGEHGGDQAAVVVVDALKPVNSKADRETVG
jgi:hypothetical protein